MDTLRKPNTVWTCEMDVRLTMLTQEKMQCHEISKIMNIGYKNVRRRIAKLGLIETKCQYKITTEEEKTILSLITKGLLLKDIAVVTNIPERSLTNFCYKNKLYINPKEDISDDWSIDAINVLVQLNSENIPIRDIARVIRKRTCSVTKKLNELGLMRPQILRVLKNKELAKTNMRHCWKCNITYPIEDFYDSKKLSGKRKTCKRCALESSTRRNALLRQENIERLLKKKIADSKLRAKRYNMDFNLTYTDVFNLYTQQQGKCYYSDQLLSGKTNDDCSVSIDRQDSSKGYTLDNIVLCCTIVNYMKVDTSEAEFKKWITYIYHNFTKNNI